MITLDDFNFDEKAGPHNDSLWGKVIVKIKNNKTCEIRNYNTEEYLCKKGNENSFEFNDWIWTEGNYSCDCNRSLFFGYAIGNNFEESCADCSDGRYSVNIYSEKNGKLLYKEFEE